MKVMVVDDHPAMCSALCTLLDRESGYEICAVAHDAAEGLRVAKATLPDIAVIDLGLPETDGIEFIATLCQELIHCSVLVFSGREEKVYAERCLRAGAAGYLQKAVKIETILEAIKTVASGGTWLSPEMTALVVKSQVRRGKTPARGVSSLTNREVHILRMVGRGTSVREIATKLGLSPKTVETHRRRVRMKLGLGTAAELVSFAARWNERNL